MRNNAVIYFIIMTLLSASCTNKKTELDKTEVWDEVGYYSNGKLKKQCRQINSDKNLTFCEIFDSLGNLVSSGKYRNGLATGVHNYYNSEHKIVLIRQFVVIDGKESYLNQVIKLNSVGDTIKEISNYILVDVKSDTLSLGETYFATISLEAPYFKHNVLEAYFDVPDDTSFLRLIQPVGNRVEYNYIPKKKGNYVMKGKLVEMNSEGGIKKNTEVDARIIYFEQKYYVK